VVPALLVTTAIGGSTIMSIATVAGRAGVAAGVAALALVGLAAPAAAANPVTTASQTAYSANCPGARQYLQLQGANQITGHTTVNRVMGDQCTTGTNLSQAVYVINAANGVVTSRSSSTVVGPTHSTFTTSVSFPASIPAGGRVEMHTVTYAPNGTPSSLYGLRVYADGRVESFVV
jgi:hypothetical protein